MIYSNIESRYFLICLHFDIYIYIHLCNLPPISRELVSKKGPTMFKKIPDTKWQISFTIGGWNVKIENLGKVFFLGTRFEERLFNLLVWIL